MALKQLTSVIGVCVLGSVSAVALADDSALNVFGDETSVGSTSSNMVVVEAPIMPAACDGFVYDSGDSPVLNTGRTVGAPGEDRWEVYQPVIFREDVTVCGIDVDGWYVTGAPDTFEIGLYPDDGTGNPDLSNRLTFGKVKLGVPNIVNWQSTDVSPVCLSGDTQYFIGTLSEGNHWSAIYRDCPNGLASFSVKNGDFIGGKFGSTSTAMRLRGTVGCGPNDCLTMAVSDLISGGPADWVVCGATPDVEVAIVYGFNPGNTSINGFAGYCADFGIDGVNQKKVVCRKKADGSGCITCRVRELPAQPGTRILTQAAMKGTCPDPCMSNLDDQVVQ